MCETRPRALSSTMITYAELIEWATKQGPELTLASLEEKKIELFPSLKPDFEETLKQCVEADNAAKLITENVVAKYDVSAVGGNTYTFKGEAPEPVLLLEFVVQETGEITVTSTGNTIKATIVKQADSKLSVTLSLEPNLSGNKMYTLIIDEAIQTKWIKQYCAELLVKNMKRYLSLDSGGYGVSRAVLNEYAESTFAGYCYPHAPKSVGAMVMVVTEMKDTLDSPHNQVAKAIEKHKAKDTSLEQPGSYLYQTLLQCNEKFALVQPMNVAVSGTEEPGLYCVENYVCPTPLFYNIGTEVYQAVLARAKPKTLKECTCFEEMWSKIELKNDRNLERSLGATLYAETLLYTTTADAGLRFKDRQSTKMSVAKRNKFLWEFVRLLEASSFFT